LSEYLKTVVDAIQAEELMRHEGLPDTVEMFLEYFNIKIIPMDSALSVDIWPKSGEGHDYMFRVDKEAGKIIYDSLAIGEILPDPEETE
jgi:hypothetical protein